MYGVIAIAGAALLLAACSSTDSDFSKFTANNPFKFEPPKDTVRFESEPPGADAKTSTGQSCRTPCAMAMPADKPFTVTYTLNGYQPDTEQVQYVGMGDGSSKLRPNPVLVQLTPAAPPPKPKKKVRRKHTATKPAAKPAAKPKAQSQAAPPPMQPAPSAQAPSPWPSAPSR